MEFSHECIYQSNKCVNTVLFLKLQFKESHLNKMKKYRLLYILQLNIISTVRK